MAKWKRNVSAMLLALCLPVSAVHAYDDDTSDDQETTLSRLRGHIVRTVLDRLLADQEVMQIAQRLKAQHETIQGAFQGQLQGRSQRLFQVWQERQWHPLVFAVQVRGQKLVMITGREKLEDQGRSKHKLHYVFFKAPTQQ